jgi:hypothetical protein
MWYYPAAFFLDKRDVIGAWLICGAIAMAFFGYPALTDALDSPTGDRHYAAASPGFGAERLRSGAARCASGGSTL